MRWLGRTVHSVSTPFGDLGAILPKYERGPLRITDGGESPYLDVITTRLAGGDPIPVWTVEKSYSLFQHSDLYDVLAQAFAIADIPTASDASVWLTPLGERMRLAVRLPFVGDPGDGHPVALNLIAQNSVDRSTALGVWLEWLRLVCVNGLVVATRSSQMRRLHTGNLRPEVVAKYVRAAVEGGNEAHGLMRDWAHEPVDVRHDNLDGWLRRVVARAWTPPLATRVWHVVVTGHDVRVLAGRRVKSDAPLEYSDVPFEDAGEVPGAAAPARTRYDVAQALSWVASRAPSVPDRNRMVAQVAGLVREL
jgi:hypothetical protein